MTNPKVELDDFSLVDPELLPALQSLPRVEFSASVLALARARPHLPPLPPPFPQPKQRRIPGAKGAPDVSIMIVGQQPRSRSTRRPVFLHMHGGGYVTEMTLRLPLIQTMARDCDCVVASVDYRLAPETQYPGALDDNYAALHWVYANAEPLGIDRNRIAVGGESAGGGHAAALALRARDRGEIPILFQLLMYPMLDDRTGSVRAAPPTMGRHVWTEASNRFGWTSLLGVPAGSPEITSGTVPARVHDLSNLPPTWIGTGALDLFAEESITFARRLMGAGVATELMVVPGAYHGFNLIAPEAAVSKRFTEGWKSALRRAFAKK